MKRTVRTLAIAMVVCAAAYGTSHAAPIAPLTGIYTQSNKFTQVYWHRHYWGWHRRYWWHRRYYWGYPRPYYWGWRPY